MGRHLPLTTNERVRSDRLGCANGCITLSGRREDPTAHRAARGMCGPQPRREIARGAGRGLDRRLGSDHRPIKVWDSATGAEIVTLRGHSDTVSDVTFSPDGQRLASCSPDATVKTWDWVVGEEGLTLRLEQVFKSVAFSPDGHRLACVGD